jgi:TPR repeat protein
MPENLQKAIKWYSFAAEYGYEEAQEALNEIL